ncbi:hypothetical protein AncyloWKF20_09125 [Ancylobacter sp. WKF20]|uniref:hypothetical protein n=1 Tax=Ancylobacter sp. WKF20 TaxID=3039801 RepID=UPI00243454C3|nr:hypothetical protein [Ancylobacter sp. WKF20]WGD31962.1 hypothetical protein AncyloWKF20_09125 [Ancylobacter sp. WKF20]
MIDRLRRQIGRRLPTTAVLLAALALGACQTGNGNKPVAAASISGGTKTIAFESIDGPPQPVFDKLVASLSSEASAQKVPVVSRQSPAAYRVRGYLAAAVTNGKGEVDWAWDVFDADQERVLRVSGTEKVGDGKDVWNTIDDATLTRIAAQSLDEIKTRLANGVPAPAASAQPAASEPVSDEPGAAPPVREDDGPVVAEGTSADEPGAAVAEAAAPAGGSALTFAAHP